MRTETWRTRDGRELLVHVAETVWERARGLLGRPELAAREALFLPQVRSVHTVGMRRAILVAFLDADLRVLAAVPVPPGRVLLPRRGARHVLELGVGAALGPGERLHRAG